MLNSREFIFLHILYSEHLSCVVFIFWNTSSARLFSYRLYLRNIFQIQTVIYSNRTFQLILNWMEFFIRPNKFDLPPASSANSFFKINHQKFWNWFFQAHFQPIILFQNVSNFHGISFLGAYIKLVSMIYQSFTLSGFWSSALEWL